jgi:ABC-2 type transport system ATP-binding protein
MSAVESSKVSYSYGHRVALRDLDLEVPEGALYALLGPNGSGKTTLLQILVGLRSPASGVARVLGIDSRALGRDERARIGYVAEGQALPGWMRLEQLEAYLAPLYPTWDASLATRLRERFDLDPKQRVGTLSRGGQMKAALLSALAPRPKLLLMDEPFTGMDALVKDELVRGLLESSGDEGWTVLLSSHDIGELELLADWVGVLDCGRMLLSEPMDHLRQRFKHVDVALADSGAPAASELPNEWLGVERSGERLSFLVTHADRDLPERSVAARLPQAAHIGVRDATLREVFVAVAKQSLSRTREVAA